MLSEAKYLGSVGVRAWETTRFFTCALRMAQIGRAHFS